MYLKKEAFEKLTDIIYPRVCPFCDTIVNSHEDICSECKKRLVYIKEPRCRKCSKQLNDYEQEYCYDCQRTNHKFEYGFALYQNDDMVKKSIYRFKYANQRYFAKVYAKEIIRIYKDEIYNINPDALIPIPLHKSKLKKRGFNQAYEIAKEIGKELDIPVYDRLVIRKKKTKQQKYLDYKQRKNNVKNAFIIKKNDVKLKKVIIVDDIYTTGFTIDALADCLISADSNNKNEKEHGFKIYFITVAIGEGL